MAGDILAKVANLLEEAINYHTSIRGVILSTREGVVVASLSQDETIDPTLLATVSAALVWASMTTLANISSSKPTHLIHDAGVNRILIVLQHQYQMVTVISKAADQGLDIEELKSTIQSIGTRIEILMRSTQSFISGSILGRLVETFPSVSQALVLTTEGLPIASIGFKNDIEVAALAGSIFANGMTYSEATEGIIIGSDEMNFIIRKLDDKKVLAVAIKHADVERVVERIKEMIESGI
jgi:predicted regulator of Ras-like GTPase activity (Roadblock/LC7/MglB family)